MGRIPLSVLTTRRVRHNRDVCARPLFTCAWKLVPTQQFLAHRFLSVVIYASRSPNELGTTQKNWPAAVEIRRPLCVKYRKNKVPDLYRFPYLTRRVDGQ